MTYAVEIGSVVIYTRFHKDLFRHLKVDMGDTQTAWRSHKPTLRR
jgi:hypothetical protein